MADPDSRRYADDAIVDFLERTHTPHDPALEAARQASETYGIPAIQVAPSEGKLLHVLLSLARVRRAVEIGTLAGYSTIWLARALPSDGHLHSLELDPQHAEIARSHIEAAGLSDRVTVHVGDAVDTLASLATPVDAVFLDADKERYDIYGRWAAANVRSGGILIADNAFFFGRLLDATSHGAAAMRRFHEEAAQAFCTVNVPTPDGMLVGIRNGTP